MAPLRLARFIALFLLVIGSTQPVVHASDTAGAFDLQRYRGKVVVVDFWASWCAPCRQSFPWLNEIQSKYADQGLVVIGVNVDREQADAEKFLKDVPAEFKILFDPEGQLAAKYDIPGMPSSYVFDADGRLISKHIGFRNGARAERETELQDALAAHSRSARR